MMTELFRLESISENGKINFYVGTSVDDFISSKIKTIQGMPKFTEHINKWIVSRQYTIEPKLRGVSFEYYKTITYNI